MTNENEPRLVYKTEGGSFRLTGGVGNFIANSALIAAASLQSPAKESVILPAKGRRETDNQPRAAAMGDPAAILISPRFKLVFISVLIITVMCAIAEVVMASVWPTPNGPQGNVISTMDFVFKAGFGAMIGLLGGKAS